MANVEIIDQDRIDAENFLQQFLKDKLPNQDVGKGSALRDFTVTSMANIFAFLRLEVAGARKRQSLLLLGEASDESEDADVDDAVDEILSNWFLTRKTGRRSRGVISLFFSQLPDTGDSITIEPNVPFYKTATLPFIIDSATALAYSSDDVVPVTNATGVVIEYELRVPVIALESGTQYDIEPGPFVNWQFNHIFLSRVENKSKFTGAASKESTSAMLERSPTAISVRDLNSGRSIDVTLKEEFTEVDDVTVKGYGDPEMLRDLVEEVATQLRIHAGGFTDAYLRNAIVEDEEYTATVGGTFIDPREGYYILRDDSVPDFTIAGPPPVSPVIRGDIIAIYNELSGEPNRYIVDEVTANGVYVSQRSRFPLALPTVDNSYTDGEVGPATGGTDRLQSTIYVFSAADVGKWVRITNSSFASNTGTWVIASVGVNYAVLEDAAGGSPVFVNEIALAWDTLTRVTEYSIGANSPDYADKVSRRFSGTFSKTIQRSGRILLPFKPVYRITDVYIENGTDPDLSVGGRITFPVRVNVDVVQPPVNPSPPPNLDPALVQYRVRGRNPGESYSGWQIMELQVGWGGATPRSFDGETLHVVYDTLSGYDSIWEFMLGTNRRITCGSVIPKGLHPVYLSMNIQYSLAKIATEDLDETAAAVALAQHINNFDTRLDMDVSDIAAFLRETYDVIGYIAPITINYVLYAPDGRVIYYQTTDKVTVDSSKYDPSHLPYPEDQLDNPLEQGVSDDTLRYLTKTSLLTFEVV